MLELGGIPQGDYAPVPWINCSRGWAAWVRDRGARRALRPRRRGRALDARAPPARCACTSSRTRTAVRPPARLPARSPGSRRVLPEWAYGHWKSRDFYDYQHDAEADFDGYREHGLPLDAIVLDSPWETQYNTWEFNPHQFPDPEGMIAPLARGRRADRGLDRALGQPRVARRPVPAGPSLGRAARRALAQLRAGDVRRATGERAVRHALVDGHGLAGGLHQPARRGVVARAGQARAAAGRDRDQGRRRRGLVPARRRALRRRVDRRASTPGATGCATGARCSARSTRSIPAKACSSGGRAGPASRPSG